MVGSVWVIGEWTVGYWIVGVRSRAFRKYMVCIVKKNIIKWKHGQIVWVVGGFCGYGGSVWVMPGGVGSGSVDSGCHQLSENIWFVKCRTS